MPPRPRQLAASKFTEKFEQGSVDLGRALLLYPMAGPIDQPDQPQIAYPIAHHSDQVDARHKAQHGIETARDEGGRLFDALVSDRGLLNKIQFRGAVAVERAAEATSLKFCSVIIEVGGRQPGREGVGIGQAIEQPRVGRLVEFEPEVHALTGAPVVDPAQTNPHIRFQLCFGNAWCLKVELIEKAVFVDPAKKFDTRRWPPTGVWHAETGHGTHFLRMEKRSIPDDGGSPIMPDQNCSRFAQRRDKAGNIGTHLIQSIGLNRVRLVAAAVAAYVRRRHPIPGRGQGRDLVAPGVPALRPAGDKHDKWSRAGQRNTEPDAVCLKRLECRFYHEGAPLGHAMVSLTLARSSMFSTSDCGMLASRTAGAQLLNARDQS